MLPYKRHLENVVRLKNPAKSRYGFLRLDKNESTVVFPEHLVQKVKDEITAEFLMVYPEIDPLYEKIAKWLTCEINNLYLSSGSDGAIKTVFETFVEKGDTVMILDPTYAMFYVYIKLFEARLHPIKYGPNLVLSQNSIVKQIREEKPKLVCIANPNSPTGTVLGMSEIEDIISAGRDLDCVVMIDEAYGLYWPESAISLIKKYENLVVTRSFSKAFGLAAVRLGLAAGHENMIRVLHSYRPMYETNAFAVKTAMLVLDNMSVVKHNVDETLKGRCYLEDSLMKRKIPFYKSYANFVNIRVGSFEKVLNIVKRLFDMKILITSGAKGGPLEDCIRVSMGDVSQMKRLIEALDMVLNPKHEILNKF